MLESVQRETFEYFIANANPKNGLVADRTEPGAASSIAAVGLALSCYTVAVERRLWSRQQAIAMTLATLRFFATSRQGEDPSATGHHGFYYHFLDMTSGARAPGVELSTIDTGLLLAGMLSAAQYFSASTDDEPEIRELVELIYRRVDWAFVAKPDGTLRHGWTPERGYLEWSWDFGYSEALLLYVLALGSPTQTLPDAGYRAWTKTFERKQVYGIDYLYAGPLFIHQLPHVWLDLRGIRDDRAREVGFDYFENSRRATLVHRQYGIENPLCYDHYSEHGWGITASDGPGPAVKTYDGVEREFYSYLARGAPFGPDDGTLSPWAVVASLPFAPEIVIPTIRHAIERLVARGHRGFGFDASFNPTFRDRLDSSHGWSSPWKLGLNEGPIILMIENCFSELVWNLMKASPHIVRGLRRAGFTGGWLDR